MPEFVSHEQIRAARKTDLYTWVLQNMPSSTYKREGNSIRLTSQHALSIRKGYSGYTNFATGETGNPIDFCVHVLGMGFVEAVKTLLSDTMSYETAIDHNTIARPDPNSPLILPEPASDNGRVMAYLVKHRGIPPPLVQHLFSEGLLYQAADHGNAVFVNESHTYAEIRGTIHNVKFHRSVSGSHKDAYWSFSHQPGSRRQLLLSVKEPSTP